MNPRLQALARYMAETSPRDVNRLGYKYGFLPADSAEGREGMIYRGLMEEGESFLKDVAMFHPDREMILAANGEQNYVGTIGYPPMNDTLTGTSKRYSWRADGVELGTTTGPEELTTVKKEDDPKFMLRIVAFIIVAFLLYQLLIA